MIYKGDKLSEISFPLGGIGSGSIGLSGNGRLIDWEIFNRPDKGSDNRFTHFAVKASGKNGIIDCRVLNGDLPRRGYIGQFRNETYCGFGFGPFIYTMGGFPHFESCEFLGEFPVAKIDFADRNFPAKVSLTAFNPFIPLNEDDSSIPAAFFEIEFENTSDEEIDYDAAFSVKNPFDGKGINSYELKNGFPMIRLGQSDVGEDSTEYGELTVACEGKRISYQQYWYRGGWSDGLETYWRNFTEQPSFSDRVYGTPDKFGDMATISSGITLKPGEKKSLRFVLSWNIPNNYNYWLPYKDGEGKDISWKNYYAVLFPHSSDSALYALKNWDRLYRKTDEFRNEIFSSTLPDCVKDAVSATVSVLKSPTVLRLENGGLYGWEGCQAHEGACEGSCTHVWNYAYALPFLFPRLERSMREMDYKYNMREGGKLEFRMALPLGRHGEPFHACVDGQLGGVIKCFREWKICGDTEWLRERWEDIKAALSYAWSDKNPDKWDRDRDGILEGRQHNTLDTELFTPSSWLQGYYVAALEAAAEMARALGDNEFADEMLSLSENGRKYVEDNLYNGEYYCQKVDLSDKSLIKGFDDDTEGLWHEESHQIKYQIAEGCEVDQVIADWHTRLCGLKPVFDDARRKSALESIYRYNYKTSMRNIYNPWRLFCINDESGVIMCTYPKEKPAIPISYCQETMHGFEYQLAATMIANGLTDMGVSVVKSIRDRYNGENRNPWNEIECGSNYARSMASFSLIPIFSGFEFDMTKGHIGFKPVSDGPFRSLWSLDPAWGRVETDDNSLCVTINSGELELCSVGVPFDGTKEVYVDGEAVGFSCENKKITFDSKIKVKDSIICKK